LRSVLFFLLLREILITTHWRGRVVEWHRILLIDPACLRPRGPVSSIAAMVFGDAFGMLRVVAGMRIVLHRLPF